MKNNGIHHANKTIKKISGPCSMFYLKPSGNSPFYGPPILIFGDYHTSYDFMCKPCISKKGKDSCYEISSSELYATLSGKEKNVDMYTEAFPNTSGSMLNWFDGFRGGPMFDMRKFIYCFPNASEYDKTICLNPNIRWHTSDARFGNIKYSKSRKNVIEMLLFYPAWVNSKDGTTKADLDKYFMVHGFNPSESELETVRLILKSIIKADSSGNNLEYDIENYVDTYFSIINPSNSLIAKQISKQQQTLDKEFWKRAMKDMLKSRLLVKIPFKRMREYDLYTDFYGTSDLAIFSAARVATSKEIFEFFLGIQNALLDIYFLTRVFKRTSPSFLTICYFGNSHATSIVNTLFYTFKYVV